MTLYTHCLALALLLCSSAWAQDGEPPPNARAEHAAEATKSKPTPSAFVLGLAKSNAERGSALSTHCYYLEDSKGIREDSAVIVVRKRTCGSGASRVDYYDVLYRGKPYVMKARDVFMTAEGESQLSALTEEQIADSLELWQIGSREAAKVQMNRAIRALKATSSQGIAVLKARIFDVSEYTEGTGFSASIYNSSKKTIKYVTFGVVGLNAVNDPVRDRLRGGTVVSLRGIGPVEPGGTGSWSKDYMWMTDVVESYRLAEIRLEYTDGTSKTLKDVEKLFLSRADYETLSEDDD